ncbi:MULTISPECIES: DUF5658 family protein [unclassified Archaeoglobus]|jgi:hypothetical protein|uniref:DUF5658 family protein n=1 Tax=unclassified Archaeoglobus TaxID=2643606 RepID=UPI0025BEF5EF|nr:MULTISPECIES: DUF5658 family protein [unclassified Archaeoglobus]
MGKNEMLIASFTAVNLMDYLTTIQGIQKGFHEVNSLVASMTPFSFLLLKLLIIFSISAAFFVLRNFNLHIARGVYIGIALGVAISTIFVGIIAAHNMLLLAGFPEVEVLAKIVSRILI